MKLLPIPSAFESLKALSPVYRRHFHSGAWQVSERVVQCISLLLGGAIVARYLGPERQGIIAFAQGIMAILLTITHLGLDDVVLRRIVSEPASKPSILASAAALRRIVGTFLFAGLLVLAIVFYGTEWSQESLLLCIMAVALPLSFLSLGTPSLQAEGLLKKLSLPRMSASLAGLASRALAALVTAGLPVFAGIVALDSLLGGWVAARCARKADSRITTGTPDRAVAKSLLRESWPLMLSGLSIIVYMKIDQLMLKEMSGAASAGIYVAAVRLSETWGMVPALVCANVFPSLLRLRLERLDAYYARFQRLLDVLAALALAIIAAVLLASPTLVNLLYGAEYRQSAPVLQILIFSIIPIFLGIPTAQWMVAEGLSRQILYRSVIGMVANIVLNLFWIPAYGVYGAAWATVVSYFISVPCVMLVSARGRRVVKMMGKSLAFGVLWSK